MARYKCFTAAHKLLHAPGDGGVRENVAVCKRGGPEDHVWRRTYYFKFLLRI